MGVIVLGVAPRWYVWSSMLTLTLKQGIEVMLKESIPEISNVYDATDHAGGTNPYFQ